MKVAYGNIDFPLMTVLKTEFKKNVVLFVENLAFLQAKQVRVNRFGPIQSLLRAKIS